MNHTNQFVQKWPIHNEKYWLTLLQTTFFNLQYITNALPTGSNNQTQATSVYLHPKGLLRIKNKRSKPFTAAIHTVITIRRGCERLPSPKRYLNFAEIRLFPRVCAAATPRPKKNCCRDKVLTHCTAMIKYAVYANETWFFKDIFYSISNVIWKSWHIFLGTYPLGKYLHRCSSKYRCGYGSPRHRLSLSNTIFL